MSHVAPAENAPWQRIRNWNIDRDWD